MEKRVGFTRKVGSLTANQAFTPSVLLRRDLYWTRPYPLGVRGTPRNLLIDIDECGTLMLHDFIVLTC